MRTASFRLLRQFLRDRRGVSAVEFALIAPVLLLIYLGSTDLADGLDVNKKISRSASSLADLVTRQISVSAADIDDMFAIGNTSLLPYRRTNPKIRITALKVTKAQSSSTYTVTVDWSRANVANFAAVAGSKGDLPAALIATDAYFIKVDVQLDYKPLNSWISTSIPMSETYYLSPRYTNSIPCNGC
ncbi:Flp pilus assembly protein TadG [Ochrobactrum sp. 19YEA23]|uniref:TadE/TadG family type IV pilus assembly protein n=1 Tax=Ochrobactrum sp. 19YEA23 TaxID=3039854 RepID=UPI002478479B|nr:Flp pilus assembly protein TadG [Ochrobactrum sp. 19YEA23]